MNIDCKDHVILWKTANVSIGNDEYMFVVYYYHTEKGDKSKSFYKCSVKIDSKQNWMSFKDSLLKESPAEPCKTSMLGLDDDYQIFYSRHTMNKADVFKWFGLKFSPTKVYTLDEFKNELTKAQPFLRTYSYEGNTFDIMDVEKLPRGKWLSSYKEKKERKSYGTIIH